MLHMVITDVVILLVGVGHTLSQTWLVDDEVIAINSHHLIKPARFKRPRPRLADPDFLIAMMQSRGM
jgi:uncharacterized membrane protein (Fun14 family)